MTTEQFVKETIKEHKQANKQLKNTTTNIPLTMLEKNNINTEQFIKLIKEQGYEIDYAKNIKGKYWKELWKKVPNLVIYEKTTIL